MDQPPRSPSTEPGTTTWKKAYRAFRIIVLVAIVGWIIARMVGGREQIQSLEWNATWTSAGLAVAAAVAGYHCLFAGWLILLGRLDLFRTRRLPAYLRIWWTSYMYRYVPGKVMVVVERARMGEGVGIPASVGATLAIVETALAVSAAFLVTWVGWSQLETRVLGAGVAFALLGGIIFLLPTVLRRAAAWGPLSTRAPALRQVNLRPLDVLLTFPAFVAHYLLMGWSFAITVKWFATTSDIPTLPLVGAYALSHVVGLLTLLAPGGLGVREGALGLQLARWFGEGSAAAIAVFARIWFSAVELVCFLAALLVGQGVSED